MLSKKSTKSISFLLAASLLTAAVPATTQAGWKRDALLITMGTVTGITMGFVAGLYCKNFFGKKNAPQGKTRGTMTQQPNYKTAGTTMNQETAPTHKIKQENRLSNSEVMNGHTTKWLTGSKDVLLEEWFTIRTKK